MRAQDLRHQVQKRAAVAVWVVVDESAWVLRFFVRSFPFSFVVLPAAIRGASCLLVAWLAVASGRIRGGCCS